METIFASSKSNLPWNSSLQRVFWMNFSGWRTMILYSGTGKLSQFAQGIYQELAF